MLNKDDAVKIAKKLRAVRESERNKNSAHDVYSVFHQGVYVAHFGIRRGSRKDQSHAHIPPNLHISPKMCVGLAQCYVSLEDWVAEMKKAGLLTPPSHR